MRMRVFRSDKGDCNLLYGSTGGKMLCDGGMRESFIACVAPHLEAEAELDLVYVSHVDDDHIAGVLQLLDNCMAWKVYAYHQAQGDKVRQPKVPPVPKIDRIWHNAFHDQIGDNAGAVEDMLAAMVPVLASVDDDELAHVAAENSAIVNSNLQALQVSQRIGANQLDIPLNEGDRLLMIRDKQRSFRFGSLDVQIIAPFAEDVEVFRNAWNNWLRSNSETVKTLHAKAKVDAEAIGNELDALLAPLALEAKELGNRKLVTPPNLASIMLYVQDASGKTALLTGDGHADDILKGLEFIGALRKQGSLHVDLLNVQHHGSEHNMTEEFAERITADHYVFCGNGFSGNPEPIVIDALFRKRKGGAGPDRPFTFYFNSSRQSETTKPDRAAHMGLVEEKVRSLQSDDARLQSFFLTSNDYSTSPWIRDALHTEGTMAEDEWSAEKDLPAGSRQGVALSLSGGGYRAMMFHVGALCRLNQVGLLGKLARISSVSGGSIAAGALGLMWNGLGFQGGTAQHFDRFVARIRDMADTTVDVGAVVAGIFLPGTISDRVAKAYDDVLFKGATLQDLPDDQNGNAPRFVINATNVQTSVLWRFSRPFMGDWRVGLVESPTVPLSVAVAASSAFPPILSPTTLPITRPVTPTKGADLGRPPYSTKAVLSDGGVYDNIGLETVKHYKTLLVSDAGQKIAPEEDPAHDWARHSVRILDTINNQVRSLRKRHLIESYQRGDHNGCYWGIRTDFANYGLTQDPLGAKTRNPLPLAEIPTRLEKMPRAMQDSLMNWGYAICDAALRAHINGPLQQALGIQIQPPTDFPFPGGY